MKEFLHHRISFSTLLSIITLLAVLGVVIYASYNYTTIEAESAETSKVFEGVIDSLSARLASSTIENENLLTLLRARTADFQNEVEFVKTRISEFEKLNSLDAQLLQKYSKVYFLNENYLPAELSLVETDFLFDTRKPVQIHSKIKGRTEALVREARAAGIDINIVSGYRSFGAQADLKSQYRVTYGSGANRFSAEQGYSEHQLGTAVDFGTKKSGGLAGESSGAYDWLRKNAHRFGFVLSYPKGNAYYMFEPWHWRYVGIELATRLHDQGKNFYDLPQRDIDPYLIKIFD